MTGELSVVLGNIEESLGRTEREEKKRLGHISELCYTLLHGPCGAACTEEGPALAAAMKVLSSLRPLPSARDRASLIEGLFREGERCFGRPLRLSDFSEGPRPPLTNARVAYVKNPQADLAYRRFAELLSEPSAFPCKGSASLADGLRNGYADYAVIPFLSGGRPLPSAVAFIEEHSFFVTAVTAASQGDEGLSFALLAREPVSHRPPTHLLFRLEEREGETLPELLKLLSLWDIRCLFLDSSALPYAREYAVARLLVSGDGEALSRLFVYLTLYAPGVIGHGFYFELN